MNCTGERANGDRCTRDNSCDGEEKKALEWEESGGGVVVRLPNDVRRLAVQGDGGNRQKLKDTLLARAILQG